VIEKVGVMTPLPPKQGLKLNTGQILKPLLDVMTPLPPKQGLKQASEAWGEEESDGYDTTSTKTRIETKKIRRCQR